MTSTPPTSPGFSGDPLAIIALLLILPTACSPTDPPAVSFRNIGTDTAYSGDEACFSCHEDQYLGYRDHGMSRSFYHDSTLWQERAQVDTTLVHPGTGLSYRVFTSGDTLFQEEILPGKLPGDPTNLKRRADLVMGSGNAARTFLSEVNGRLFELPITWYAQRDRWDFSPGYRVRNARFERQIPDRCMACHNGYPQRTGGLDGKYESLPSGIGCERCHGPGELHVNERLDIPEPAGEFDDTIVNPARLDVQQRLDICQQCHLQTTVSVLRRGRDAFDFVPSESLSDHIALFFTPPSPRLNPNSVSVVSHADRMQRSACFVASAGQTDPMECVTCHDPHAGFRQIGPSYFNATCVGCHPVATLSARVVPDAQASHTESSNCFSCHMPRVEAIDAPHSSFTDHWIRVVSEQEEDPRLESDELMLPYFQRDRGNREGQSYLGMALVVEGRRAGKPDLMASGIATLEAGLQGDGDWAEARFIQGTAYLDLGRADLAIEPLEKAVRAREDARYLDALARAHAAAGNTPDVAVRLYQRALALAPDYFETRYHYALHLQRTGRTANAEAQFRRVLDEYPWHAESHLMLAAVLFTAEPAAARQLFKEAARLDPDLRESLSRVIIVRRRTGRASIQNLLGSDVPTSRNTRLFQPVDIVNEDDALGGVRIEPASMLDEVRIFSAQGYPLRRLQAQGTAAPIWDFRDDQGRPVPTGLYLVRVGAGAAGLARLVVIHAS